MGVENQFSNYETKFIEEAREFLSDDENALTWPQAFSRVAASWLGYEIREEQFVDGSGDRGIDFWYLGEAELQIFQVKTHNPSGYKLASSNFDSRGITDLSRAKQFLLHSVQTRSELKNEALSELVDEFENLILTHISKREVESLTEPIIVSLNLILVGGDLTPQAQQEYSAFKESLKSPGEIAGIPIQFRSTLFTLRDLFSAKWQSENYDWRDFQGDVKENVEIFPESLDEIITSRGHALFYGHAYDLVNAYELLGYRIFEPNVRAEVKRSKVNANIEETASKSKGRKVFKLLNNGITIVCAGFEKPRSNRQSFRIKRPGVINGLQTITALARAYRALDEEEKEDFRNDCFVLVRIIESNVIDINQVVESTNNQNPIKPRSLVANRPEQIYYEQQFADLGWFYERKEGAWSAFQENPRQWTTLSNKRRSHFTAVSGKGGRNKERRIDSPDLAQAWLAFIGFSASARDEKRSLFDDRWYDLIFRQRPRVHAARLDFSLQAIKENTIKQHPDPPLLLVTQLASEFAKRAAGSRKDVYDTAKDRIPASEANRLTQMEFDARVNEDIDFLVGDATIRARFLFVEFLGFLLFNSLGEDVHHSGYALLRNRSLGDLKENYNLDEVAALAQSNHYEIDDLLCVCWNLFSTSLKRVIFDRKNPYINAPNRSKFLHTIDVRRSLVTVTGEIDSLLKSGPQAYHWARGMQGKGLFEYISQTVSIHT